MPVYLASRSRPNGKPQITSLREHLHFVILQWFEYLTMLLCWVIWLAFQCSFCPLPGGFQRADRRIGHIRPIFPSEVCNVNFLLGRRIQPLCLLYMILYVIDCLVLARIYMSFASASSVTAQGKTGKPSMQWYQSNITHNYTCPESISWDMHTRSNVDVTDMYCSLSTDPPLLSPSWFMPINEASLSCASLSLSLPFSPPLLRSRSIPPCISVTLIGSHKRKRNACKPSEVENTGESCIQQSLRANAHRRDLPEMWEVRAAIHPPVCSRRHRGQLQWPGWMGKSSLWTSTCATACKHSSCPNRRAWLVGLKVAAACFRHR